MTKLYRLHEVLHRLLKKKQKGNKKIYSDFGKKKKKGKKKTMSKIWEVRI